MPETITRSNINGQIATLTLDMPDKGANILSSHVLGELDQHLDRLSGESELKGLIILSGKPGTFIAGADLREFVASLDADRAEIVNLCRMFSQTQITLRYPRLQDVTGCGHVS